MALQAVNGSVRGCGEQANHSVEVTEYNMSCANSSDLPKPASRTLGKTRLAFSPLLCFNVSNESSKLRC